MKTERPDIEAMKRELKWARSNGRIWESLVRICDDQETLIVYIEYLEGEAENKHQYCLNECAGEAGILLELAAKDKRIERLEGLIQEYLEITFTQRTSPAEKLIMIHKMEEALAELEASDEG